MLRTARAYQQPPTAWLGGDGSWTDRDRAITLAHTIYESMLCAECGQPMTVCRDPENSFQPVTDTCQARAVVDRHHQDRARTNTPPEPGQVVSAVLEETTTQYGKNPFLE